MASADLRQHRSRAIPARLFHTGNAFQRTGTHARRTCGGVRPHVRMAVGRLVPGLRGLVAWGQRFRVVEGTARGWWQRILRSNMHSDLIRPNGIAIAIGAGTLRGRGRTGVGPRTGRI